MNFHLYKGKIYNFKIYLDRRGIYVYDINIKTRYIEKIFIFELRGRL